VAKVSRTISWTAPSVLRAVVVAGMSTSGGCAATVAPALRRLRTEPDIPESDVRICPPREPLMREDAHVDSATLAQMLREQPSAPPRGRGFNGVRTTGIYCRDGCSAKPLARNV